MRVLIIISVIVFSLKGLSAQGLESLSGLEVEWKEMDLQGISKITQIDSIFLVSEVRIQESSYVVENGRIISEKTYRNDTLISESNYEYSESGVIEEHNWYREGKVSGWILTALDNQQRIIEHRSNFNDHTWENDSLIFVGVNKSIYFKKEYEYFDELLFSITDYFVTEDDIDENAVTYFEYDSLNRKIESSYFNDGLTLGYFKPNSSDINDIDTAFYNTKGQYSFYEYSGDSTLIYSMSRGKKILERYEIVNLKNKITELAYLDKDGLFLKLSYEYINQTLLDHYKREIMDLDRMTFDYTWMDELKISYNSSNLPISKIEYADDQIIKSSHYFYTKTN